MKFRDLLIAIIIMFLFVAVGFGFFLNRVINDVDEASLLSDQKILKTQLVELNAGLARMVEDNAWWDQQRHGYWAVTLPHGVTPCWRRIAPTSSKLNLFRAVILACERKAGGKMHRASSLFSTSTVIHALCSPSKHPQSACVTKWEPVLRNVSMTRAHATTSAS